MQTEIRTPRHVSIIMDGNGRWARERGLAREMGHVEGVVSVRAVTEEAVREGIEYLSLFAFSEENWGRPEGEVKSLMKLIMKSLKEEVATFMNNGVRFLVLGNREHLPAAINESITALEALTSKNKRMTMILFLSYSGKWDIFQAARKMAADLALDPGKEIGVEDFDNYLVTSGIPDPDVIIRTSGEQRLSNYLLWQGAYSEFVFVDKLWPDFREQDFADAMKVYASRDRRYGKVK